MKYGIHQAETRGSAALIVLKLVSCYSIDGGFPLYR